MLRSIRFDLLAFLIGFCVFSWNCADEYDYNYSLKETIFFPLVKGKYIVYTSDSIVYRGGGLLKDTISSFIKIENVDTFLNTDGERIVVRYHWFKYKESDPWQFKTRSSAFVRDNNILNTIDNITLVKMPVLPRKNMKFDPAIYVNPELELQISGEIFSNFYKDWNGKILDTTTPYNFQNNTLNACRVQLVADTLLKIQKRIVTETYGANVGLLERDEVFLFDDQSTNTPLEIRAKKGYIHRLRLLSFN